MRLRVKNGVYTSRVYLDHDWIGGTRRRTGDTNREIHVYVEPLKGQYISVYF